MSFNSAMLEQMQAEGLDLDACIRVLKAGEKDLDPTNAERQARYRARKDVDETTWRKLRIVVLERDANKCTYCGATERLEVDHVIPLVQGGTSTVANLTTACRSCNGGKSGRTPEEWLA